MIRFQYRKSPDRWVVNVRQTNLNFETVSLVDFEVTLRVRSGNITDALMFQIRF